MSDPTTTNKTASIVNQILNGLIVGVGENLIEAEAISAQPWLGLPIVKQLLELFLSFIGKFFYTQFAMVATKIIIDMQVSSEEDGANGAFKSLQLAIASGDKDAITKASSDLDAAYGSLIHYDGSASP